MAKVSPNVTTRPGMGQRYGQPRAIVFVIQLSTAMYGRRPDQLQDETLRPRQGTLFSRDAVCYFSKRWCG